MARKVGIPHLLGKKAFYVGLLIAASQASAVLFTLGLLAAIRARARGNENPAQEAPGEKDRKPVAIVTHQDIPALASCRAITPAHDPGAVRQELYRLPGVAQEQTRDVVHHRRQSLLPGLRPARGKRRGCGSGSTFRTKTCATGGRSAEWRQPGAPTSPWYGVSGSPRERRSDSIRLEAGAVDIISAKGWIRVPRGYHVLRKDGIRTGLAIAPWVEEKQGELVVTPGSWVITHLSSGLAMTQPYSSVAEARLLASILAQIDWRRPTEAISRREMEATRQVIKGYNEALVEVMARSGDRALAGSFMQPADLFQHSS